MAVAEQDLGEQITPTAPNKLREERLNVILRNGGLVIRIFDEAEIDPMSAVIEAKPLAQFIIPDISTTKEEREQRMSKLNHSISDLTPVSKPGVFELGRISWNGSSGLGIRSRFGADNFLTLMADGLHPLLQAMQRKSDGDQSYILDVSTIGPNTKEENIRGTYLAEALNSSRYHTMSDVVQYTEEDVLNHEKGHTSIRRMVKDLSLVIPTVSSILAEKLVSLLGRDSAQKLAESTGSIIILLGAAGALSLPAVFVSEGPVVQVSSFIGSGLISALISILAAYTSCDIKPTIYSEEH